MGGGRANLQNKGILFSKGFWEKGCCLEIFVSLEYQKLPLLKNCCAYLFSNCGWKSQKDTGTAEEIAKEEGKQGKSGGRGEKPEEADIAACA